MAIISAIIAATDECIKQCGLVEYQGEEQVEEIKKLMIKTAQSITAEDVELLRGGLDEGNIIRFPGE